MLNMYVCMLKIAETHQVFPDVAVSVLSRLDHLSSSDRCRRQRAVVKVED